MGLRVWRVPYSTNVERVSIALAHKGLEAEWIEVPYGDRTEIERVSGQPLVPVLEHDGRVIPDSTEILRYLDELQPDPLLWPREPSRRAEAEVPVPQVRGGLGEGRRACVPPRAPALAADRRTSAPRSVGPPCARAAARLEG